MKRLGCWTAMGVCLTMLVGCESTQLSTSWKDPDASALRFQKVAVVVLNSSPAERRAEEDEIVRQIKRATAIASYSFVPDAELRNHEKVKASIRQQGFDGVIVLRMISADKQMTYVPGHVSYWNDGSGFGYDPIVTTPGYYTTDTIVRAEVSVYSVSDGKLIWAGASNTINPASAKDLALQIAKATGAELRKQGLME